MADKMMLFAVLLAVTALFVAAPALIAMIRQHPEKRLIAKLSPLTLFSFILWFALIAWAWTGKEDDAVISRYVAKLRANNMLPWLIVGLIALGLIGTAATLLL